jgi:hypothetical protein
MLAAEGKAGPERELRRLKDNLEDSSHSSRRDLVGQEFD